MGRKIRVGFRWALAVLPVTLFGGCAAIDQQALTPESFRASGLGDGGCVNMMLGAVKRGDRRSGFIHHGLSYRPVGSSEIGGLYQTQSGLSDTPKDIDDNMTRATAMRVCLKPGEYEIFQTSAYLNTGSSEKSVRSERDFSVPFKVGLGQELYLGRVLANGVWGKNMFGVAIPVGITFVVEDQMAADAPLFRSQHPAMAELTSAVLMVGPDASPYFMTK